MQTEACKLSQSSITKELYEDEESTLTFASKSSFCFSYFIEMRQKSRSFMTFLIKLLPVKKN